MNQRINFFLVLSMLFISASSSSISTSTIFVLFISIITLLLFALKNIKIDNFFIFFTVAYFLLSLIYFLKFEYVDILYIFYFYTLLMYAYMTIKIVGYDFFIIYHNIVYFLSLISIPFFILQLIMFDTMFDFVGFFQKLIPFLSYKNDVFANNFLFTIEKGAIYRNSGFAWEPKGFSNFLILAILINTNLYSFKMNKQLVVFFIALMTTFSTVGYVILFTAFTLYLSINRKINTRFIFPLIIFIISIIISSSDFIYKKIYREVYTMNEQADMIYDRRYFKSRSLGRFGSLLIDYNDFLKHPLLGYGIQRKESSFKQLRTVSKYNDTKLVRVNGFSDRLVSFGLMGMIFYLFAIYKSFENYFKYYNTKGAIVIVFMFLLIEFATTLTTDPFWMIFLFLFLIKDNAIKNSKFNNV